MRSFAVERLAVLSLAVRESSLKRLRTVPEGFENRRIDNAAMSFADTARHLIDCDRGQVVAWLRVIGSYESPR